MKTLNTAIGIGLLVISRTMLLYQGMQPEMVNGVTVGLGAIVMITCLLSD